MVPSDVSRPPIIMLVGATGTGKSGLAMAWSRRWPLEIVNLDASQVYREMDIGTAKPTREERAEIPHHLFDIVAPDDPLDAGRYLAAAEPVIQAVLARGRLPLFVGGTGLYARVLLHGLAKIPDVPSQVRTAVQQELARRGAAALHRDLASVDPEAAGRISENDPQRITRALEVFRHTGRTITAFQQEHLFAPSRVDAMQLCLDVDRAAHRSDLARRVDAMFAAGFVAEVKSLLAAGWDPELRSFKALGYRQVIDYLAGRISEREARYRVVTLHARYAKRQRTWFRRMAGLRWFSFDDRPAVEAELERFIARHVA